jgi:hypothetical protein
MSENNSNVEDEKNLRLVDPVLPIPATVTIEGSLAWPKIWGVIFSIYWIYVTIRWGVRPGYAMQLGLFVILTFGVYKSSRVCSVLLAILVAKSLAEEIFHSGIKLSQLYELVALYMIIQGTVAMFRGRLSNVIPYTETTSADIHNRNVGDLIGWFIIWYLVFTFVGGIFMGAIIATQTHFQHDARDAINKLHGPILFVSSFFLSAALTIIGKLPGTKKISTARTGSD